MTLPPMAIRAPEGHYTSCGKPFWPTKLMQGSLPRKFTTTRAPNLRAWARRQAKSRI